MTQVPSKLTVDPSKDDYQSFHSNSLVTSRFKDGENIIFSCEGSKKNKSGIKQKRSILITNMNFINVQEPGDIKKIIELKDVLGVTKSL